MSKAAILVVEMTQHPQHPGPEVWVVQIDWYGPTPGDYAGWISVHKTLEGARARLEKRAAEYELDLAAIDSGEDTSGSTYGISHLGIED
jgi:hypothetical protein